MAAVGAAMIGLAGAAPTHAEPVSYGSNGVFGVGATPREGWATASIPARTASTSRRPCTRI
jgi:hypothetical protein